MTMGLFGPPTCNLQIIHLTTWSKNQIKGMRDDKLRQPHGYHGGHEVLSSMDVKSPTTTILVSSHTTLETTSTSLVRGDAGQWGSDIHITALTHINKLVQSPSPPEAGLL